MPADPIATAALPVRIGVPDDVHRLMDLAMMACHENGFLSVNTEKLLQDIWSALNLHYGLIGIIGEPGAMPEAAVLLRIGTLFYSDDRCVEEKGIFVHPDFRAARARRAQRMMAFTKEVSEKLHLPLMIGVLSNERTEAKTKLYERVFGAPAGAFFLYNAQTGHIGGTDGR